MSEAMRNTIHGGMGWHEAWLNAPCRFTQPKLYSNTSGLYFTPFQRYFHRIGKHF